MPFILPPNYTEMTGNTLHSKPCAFRARCPPGFVRRTVGPLIIESLWAKIGVSTGVLVVLDDPLVVQPEI